METPGSNISYHDLSSLDELRSLAKKDEKEAVRQAAKQFESVFMSMLLSSMRKANKAFEEDNPLNTNNSEFFRDMYDQQLSTELSKNGALGLADLMVKQLSPDPAPSKLQRHLAMPGDIGEEKTLVMPHQQQKKLAIPEHASAFKQLDPERIVLNVHRSKPFSQQLAPEQAVRVTPAVGVDSLASTGVVSVPRIQQLGEETVWQNHRVAQLRKVTAPAEVMPVEKAVSAEATAAAKDGFGNDEPLAFVQQLLPAAKIAAKELGLEPMALLAQAALETGWGKKIFRAADGSQSNNLFGIKASGGWSGQVAVVDTLEYRQGSAQREKAKFRVYESAEQSMQDYVTFMKTNPRYQQALAHTSDAKSYFRQLQAAGYATDPNYAQKLTAVFEGATFNQVRKLLANQLTD
ncbi:MAG: flagellar assembly peptidoglycan hydrolase FlgJ [Gammaproteobacteria bacterium]|nr:flagellar assembly peptidoglycan hydrolase FlgJ [Gammaproteobacteria bacterium]